MPLHTKVDESARDEEFEINPVYFREESRDIPRYKLPEHGVLPRTALQASRGAAAGLTLAHVLEDNGFLLCRYLRAH